MSTDDYCGILMIGDPHLEGRTPGFRCDDYPNVILEKLAWCLEYAERERLLPAILGDLFDKPRDNPNWMLVRLLGMLRTPVLALYGNHDVHQTAELTPDDSLSLLVSAGRLQLIDPECPWQGRMSGRAVVLGGSNYRQPIPKCYPPSELPAAKAEKGKKATSGASLVADAPLPAKDGLPAEDRPLVIWMAHHDVLMPGYDDGRIKPYEAPGVDLIVNGHIHRRLADVRVGGTLWMTPGNIARRQRSDVSREHVPSALRIDVRADGHDIRYIEVPHLPFDEVFHPALTLPQVDTTRSAFVTGLAELQQRRTDSGAGLVEFLDQNLGQFEVDVAAEIRKLAQEVIDHASQ